jgi:Leucine-rich repeat (LRR) protein
MKFDNGPSRTPLRIAAVFVALTCGGAFGPATYASTTIGNGGDTVECAAADAGPPAGLYSLDYLILTATDGTSGLVPVDSWEASRDRIVSLLRAKHPDLAYSFERYLQQLFNETDYLAMRRWIPSDFPLVDISDERLVQILPANCREAGGGHLWQTVVRRQRNAQISFYYRPDIMSRLLETSAIQYSMLLVHEWLWELTDDAEVSRQANYFLHSTRAALATPRDFELILANYGIDLAEQAVRFKDYCQRPSRLRDAVLHAMRELAPGSCETVTRAFFETLGERIEVDRLFDLDLSGDGQRSEELPVLELSPGDFSGLSSSVGVSWGLSLRGNAIEYLSRYQFRDLFSLRRLDLSANALTRLHPELLASQEELASLDLSANALTSLNLDFSRNPHLAALSVARNRLAAAPAGLRELPLEFLDLSDNAIESLPEGLLSADVGSLGHLDLARNRLSALPLALGPSLSVIKYLDLSGNPLGHVPEDFLAKHQSSDSCLFTNLAMTPHEAQQIASYRGCFTLLNAIGATDAGSPELWRQLVAYRVSLAGNHIEAVSPAVVDAWAQNRVLRELDLSGNGHATLPAPSAPTPALTVLDLSDNQLSEVPAGVLAWLDTSDPASCRIDLSGNPLSDASRAALDAWCQESGCACGL